MELDSRYRNAQVLLLGASGFIGRWVAKALSASGAKLTLVARDKTADEQIFQRWAVEGKTVEADLSALEGVRSLIEAQPPQIIFNLAGYGVDRSEQDPKLGKRINTELPIELAAAIGDIPAGGSFTSVRRLSTEWSGATWQNRDPPNLAVGTAKRSWPPPVH